MKPITACLVGGPQDGTLVSLPEPMLQFRVAKSMSRLFWRDLEDATDEPWIERLKEGVYRRGREGRNVTFYEWSGWAR